MDNSIFIQCKSILMRKGTCYITNSKNYKIKKAYFIMSKPFLLIYKQLKYYGNLGYFVKSGLRFSKKAFLPSCASSVK